MTGLQRYRRDIVKQHLRMEIFCADLVEENFKSYKEAEDWLSKNFIPAFYGALDEMDWKELSNSEKGR